MRLVERLRGSESRAKELSSSLSKEIVEDCRLLEGLADDTDLLNDVEKGILMEAIECATNIDPEVVGPARCLCSRRRRT